MRGQRIAHSDALKTPNGMKGAQKVGGVGSRGGKISGELSKGEISPKAIERKKKGG